jgi:hypothetical protein
MNSSHFVSDLHHMWLARHPHSPLFGSSVLRAFLSALKLEALDAISATSNATTAR